jgi:hypothetical protein
MPSALPPRPGRLLRDGLAFLLAVASNPIISRDERTSLSQICTPEIPIAFLYYLIDFSLPTHTKGFTQLLKSALVLFSFHVIRCDSRHSGLCLQW